MYGSRFTSELPFLSSSFARPSIQCVTPVSAGPPFEGLYLKPPSSGGLCEGVTTMPSAKCSLRPRLYTRIAREINRRRRHTIVLLNDGFHTIACQYLERCTLSRRG